MSKPHDLEKDPRATLFETFDDVRAGMLGLVSSGSLMQPMTHFADAKEGVIWFITSRETDLSKEIGQGASAQYSLVGKKHDLHAALAGRITPSDDQAKLDELWSPVVAAWFEGGREDPNVQLLRFAPSTAKVHASTGSAVHFGIEIARANLSEDHQPDVGEVAVIDFPRAA